MLKHSWNFPLVLKYNKDQEKQMTFSVKMQCERWVLNDLAEIWWKRWNCNVNLKEDHTVWNLKWIKFEPKAKNSKTQAKVSHH